MNTNEDQVNDSVWTTWSVAPHTRSFEAASSTGRVGLEQVDRKNFRVTTDFRFINPEVKADVRARLVRNGKTEEVAGAIAEDACTYRSASEDDTDLASIPPFMRWFENTYGLHTLAAIIHDRLITSGAANSGVLGSDTLSDRFFREMLGAVGVAPLKKWVLWAGVALRTRWAATGLRRASVILWVVLATSGITMMGVAGCSALFGTGTILGISASRLAVAAALMPFLAACLWGKQYGAGIVAAVSAMWILPPALLDLVGYGLYSVDEFLMERFGS
jgi:hypothetical protein